MEGILWTQLQSRYDNEHTVLLCVAYLPPSNSCRGDTAQTFYDTLLGQVYMYWNENDILICGDFNGRIGNAQDIELSDDTSQNRHPVDTVRNKYGDYLIEFLRDSGMCVMNSRVNPENDNYTCISRRGRSVVDYMIIPRASLDNASKCSVKTVSDLCEEYNLTPPFRNTPDHSVLCDLSLFRRLTSTHSDNKQSNKEMQPGVSRRVY